MFYTKRALYYILTFIGFFLSFSGMRQSTYAHNLNCATASNITIPISECNAVLDLYDSTNGSGWTLNGNRDTDTDICTRWGMSCVVLSGQVWVDGIELLSNNLVGTLPESLSGLSHLRTFNVVSNGLTGMLYSSWDAWTGMEYFEVGDNQIGGMLPDSWSSWINIQYFSVAFNQIIGTLPDSWSSWTSISSFGAGVNQLSGVLSSAWGSWANITVLFLSFNQLSGLLPSSWSGMSNLTQLNLDNNQFSGPLPDSWSSMTNIDYFTINNNEIVGYIPSSWYNSRTGISNTMYFNNNCIYKYGYNSGMQARLDTWAFLDPQNLCYTLTYTGSTGGTISGSLSQSLQPNSTGSLVTVGVDTGYDFSGWDDGYTGETRFETNVTGDMSFSALFVAKSYTLAYVTGAGGQISGSTPQIVPYGGSGTTVTAFPNIGYMFSGWSDGYTGATRTDGPIMGNVIYTGYFTLSAVTITGGGGSSGGGGGGGGGLFIDNCPNGDFSPSYYDNTCLSSGGGTGYLNSGGGDDLGNEGSPIGHGTAPLFTQQFVCKYTDGNFVAYKNTFTDMGVYEKYILIGLDHCIYHGQVRGKEFRPSVYMTYGASYKIFTRLAGLDVKESAKNVGNNRSNVYKIAGRKAGLFKGVTFPSNPDTLIESRTFAKMVQNLFTYYGRSDLSASDFVKGTSTITRGEMSKVVSRIITILE